VSWGAPNLARRPFANLRPLRRLAGLLWVAALGLLAWNVVSTNRAGTDAAAKRVELERLDGATESARARLETIEADLARRDLAAQNELVRFLNERIERRTFSWNRLLDHLAEVTPADVRILDLTPRPLDDDDEGPRAISREGFAAERSARVVALRISAGARDGEAMLEFVDRLFEHPAFERPNLSRESRRGPTTGFEVTTTYDPEAGQ